MVQVADVVGVIVPLFSITVTYMGDLVVVAQNA